MKVDQEAAAGDDLLAAEAADSTAARDPANGACRLRGGYDRDDSRGYAGGRGKRHRRNLPAQLDRARS